MLEHAICSFAIPALWSLRRRYIYGSVGVTAL